MVVVGEGGGAVNEGGRVEGCVEGGVCCLHPATVFTPIPIIKACCKRNALSRSPVVHSHYGHRIPAVSHSLSLFLSLSQSLCL